MSSEFAIYIVVFWAFIVALIAIGLRIAAASDLDDEPQTVRGYLTKVERLNRDAHQQTRSEQ